MDIIHLRYMVVVVSPMSSTCPYHTDTTPFVHNSALGGIRQQRGNYAQTVFYHQSPSSLLTVQHLASICDK